MNKLVRALADAILTVGEATFSPELSSLFLALMTVLGTSAAVAQTPGAAAPPKGGPLAISGIPTGGFPSLPPVTYQMARVPATTANTSNLPGNSWASIFSLPQLMGGGWTVGPEGVARRIVLTYLPLPPFKRQYRKMSELRIKDMLTGKSDFLEDSCVPWGMPRLVYHLMGPTFMEQPGVVVLFSDVVRAIAMDGRQHPNYDAPDNFPMLSPAGDSIGHWEGKTLVVDTTGIDPKTEIYYGVPNGGDEHVVERYTLTDPDTLQLVMTVDAPHVLEKPWVYSETYARTPIALINGGGCQPKQSREQVDAQGNLHIDLTPPGGYPADRPDSLK